MKITEIAIIGSGPAGLAAAVEAAKVGARVTLIDENVKPGGQLFKQIHKFFGSQEHGAGTRGIQIGKELCAEAEKLGVELLLDTTAYGLFEGHKLGLVTAGKTIQLAAQRIIIATGATENALPFEGWTLPGVMTAGAAQTMTNIHRVLPGRRMLMVGGGNVGLIVAYQLMQAGAEIVALVEATPQISGYYVHAAKLTRAGVNIQTSHSIKKAEGNAHVESAVIVQLDEDWQPIGGTEKEYDVDTICLSVGLTPLAELAWMSNCAFQFSKERGGYVPILDENMQTTVPDIYVVGDASGIDEASIAMEEGRIAGIAAAEGLGYIVPNAADALKSQYSGQLSELKRGTQSLQKDNSPIAQMSAPQSEFPIPELIKGPIPVIDCPERIPCNPCETACPTSAITIGKPIVNLPTLDVDKCTGCGLCVAYCPGLAIVLVDVAFSDCEALVTIPYEYLPLPQPGEYVNAVNRNGETLCRARVVRVRNPERFNRTALVSLAVPKNVVSEVKGLECKRVNKKSI